MTYTNPTWVNNNPPALNAENLNKLGYAVQQAGTEINTIKTQLASPFNYKGVVADLTALEAISNPDQNDTYYVTSEMCLYSYDGSEWGQSSLDESEYLAQIDGVAEITSQTRDLTETIGEKALISSEIFCASITEGYELNLTPSIAAQNPLAKLCYYPVVPGETIKIDCSSDTDGVWCFSTRSNLGGVFGDVSAEYDCCVVVPENANYLCVSSFLSNNTNKIYSLFHENKPDIVYRQGLISHDVFNWCEGYYLSSFSGAEENEIRVGRSDGTHSFSFPCVPGGKYLIYKPRGLRFAVGYTADNYITENKILTKLYLNFRDALSDLDKLRYDICVFDAPLDAKLVFVYYYNESLENEDKTLSYMQENIRVSGYIRSEQLDYITPQMFGVVASDAGGQDMSSVFAEMIKYLYKHKGIGEIYFPSGYYCGCLYLRQSQTPGDTNLNGLTIRGGGRVTTIETTQYYSGPAILINDVQRVVIKDLRIFSGTRPLYGETLTAYLAHKWKGISLESAGGTTLSNVRFMTLDDCVEMYGTTYATFENVYFTHTVENDAFNAIDNTSETDPDNPGRALTYSQNKYMALLPRIYNSRCIIMHNSYYNQIHNAFFDQIGCGVSIEDTCVANKLSDAEFNICGGYAIRTFHANNMFCNVRIDEAGVYTDSNQYAFRIGNYAGYPINMYTQLINVMIEHSCNGGLKIDDDVKYLQIENLSLINNSSWWRSFNYYHLGPATPEERATWNPEGWEPKPEISVGQNLTRTKIDAVFNCYCRSQMSNWTGYSLGLIFDDDGEENYNQRVNDINVLFGYDIDDPDGENPEIVPAIVKDAIVPYNAVPTNNSIIWNTEKLM